MPGFDGTGPRGMGPMTGRAPDTAPALPEQDLPALRSGEAGLASTAGWGSAPVAGKVAVWVEAWAGDGSARTRTTLTGKQ